MAERSKATGLQPAGGADTAAHGFESRSLRSNYNYAPAIALTITRAKTAQPKPYESVNLSIRLLSAELNRSFRHDVPQLPDRSQALRKAPQRPTALSLCSVR